MNATLNRYGTALRCYDNGGKTADRYTIIPPRYAKQYRLHAPGMWEAIGANAAPFHPQGIGMHVTAAPGSHLGRRVHWRDLPADVQRLARQSFPDYAPADPNAPDLDTIAHHFCIAAVWADAPEGTRPRVTRESLRTARDYAAAFIAANRDACAAALAADGYGAHPDAGSPAAAFGHDLYLTAQGHGVGFWDRDELDALLGDSVFSIGEKLTAALAFPRWHIDAEFCRGWMVIRARYLDA